MKIDYRLVAVSAVQMITLQDRAPELCAYPCYWSPEIYNNPYKFAGRHYVWPVPPSESEVIVLGGERLGEPWNQRAIWVYGDG